MALLYHDFEHSHNQQPSAATLVFVCRQVTETFSRSPQTHSGLTQNRLYAFV